MSATLTTRATLIYVCPSSSGNYLSKDDSPDMTLAVGRGRKASKQTDK